jgi:serine/threonine-protein kinase
VHHDEAGERDADETGAKLLDFGIARMLGPAVASPSDAGHAVPGVTMAAKGADAGGGRHSACTLRYADACGQLEGREAGARSDIFAFGCLLFKDVTGRRAFDGESRA